MTKIYLKRILLVDDHALFRSSLTMLLEHSLNYQVVKACDSLSTVKADVDALKPDIILMDYHMPNGDALAIGQRLKQRTPSLKLIYLTGTQSGTVLNQLVQSKADGVLHKEITPEELSDALSLVSDGQRAISQHIKDKLPPEESHFTEREFQLFRLLVQGASTKQIAEQLNISPRTAEKHRENLFKKANVQNMAQLIELGYKWQILDIEAGT